MKAAPRRALPSRPKLESLEARELLAVSAGSLDSTFGMGRGTVTLPLVAHTTNLNQDVAGAQAVGVEPDGKIVVEAMIAHVGGTSPTQQSVLTRFNVDGTLDATFGNGGFVIVPNSSAMIIQPADGKILVFGSTTDGGGNRTYQGVRINRDGSLDTKYGTNGVATYPATVSTPPTGRIDTVEAAVIQADGQVVLLGNTILDQRSNKDVAVRLNADGSLDTTYGQGGTSTLSVNVPNAMGTYVVGAALEPDGRVAVLDNVVNGTLLGHIPTFTEVGAVYRINVDGTLDTTFGATSPGVTVLPPDPAHPMAPGSISFYGIATVPTTGKIVVSGSGLQSTPSSPNELYELDTTGAFDPGFGTGGAVSPPVAGRVLVQPADGKILVDDNPNLGSGFLLERFNANGTPDTTFGQPLTPGVTTMVSAALRIPALDPSSGKLVLADSNLGAMTEGIAVSRVLTASSSQPAAIADPPVGPAYFNGSGRTVDALYVPSTGTFLYNDPLQSPGSSLPFGIPGAGQTIPAAADYLGAGEDQFAAYLAATGTYAIRTGIGSGVALQFGIPGVGRSIPVPANYEGTGRADIAVYMPSIAAFAILPSDGSPAKLVPFGTPGAGQSIPAPADYYHTGQADIAVYLAQIGAFAIQDPSGKTPGMVVPFGTPGLGKSIPVPGDYDGDGKIDLAVYVPAQAAFYYRPAKGGNDVRVAFGSPGSGELPVPGDYDGSGRTEVAIYDPAHGFFAYRPAAGGQDVYSALGTPNSGAVPLATPAGALPPFTAPGGGSGGSGIRAASTDAPGTSSPTSAAIGASRPPTVPASPMANSNRIPRMLVNQAIPEPPRLGS